MPVTASLYLRLLRELAPDEMQLLVDYFGKGQSPTQLAKSRKVDIKTIQLRLELAEDELQRIAIDRLEDASAALGSESDASDWTDELARRRCELIDREFAETLTVGEAIELRRLDRQMLAYQRKVAPLPIEELRAMHRKLQAKIAEMK